MILKKNCAFKIERSAPNLEKDILINSVRLVRSTSTYEIDHKSPERS